MGVRDKKSTCCGLLASAFKYKGGKNSWLTGYIFVILMCALG